MQKLTITAFLGKEEEKLKPVSIGPNLLSVAIGANVSLSLSEN